MKMKVLFALVSLALPALITLLLGLWDGRRLKRSLLALAGTEILANLCMLTAGRLMGDQWSAYENVLVNALVAVPAALLAARAFLDRRVGSLDALKAVCLGCGAVAVYSALTYGQVYISSDSATATLLTHSQVEHHSLFPSTWNYANGDVWTLCNSTFVAPFTLLMRNQPLARTLGSALYCAAAALGVIYLFRKLFKSDGWVLAIPLFLVFLAGGDCAMVLYEAAYTGQMLWMALGVTLAYYATQTRKARYILPYGALAFVLSVGGSRFLAEQSIPLWGAFVLTIYLEDREKAQVNWRSRLGELGFVSALILIPAVAGMGAYSWVSATHNMNNTVNNSMTFVPYMGDVYENLVTAIVNLFRCFGYTGGVELVTAEGLGNLVSMACCALVCFIVPILQARRLREEERPVQLFFAFGMLHNALMLMVAALFGLLTSRYMLTTVFAFILISARYIYAHWIRCANFRRGMWTAIFSIGAVIECVALLMSSVGWIPMVQGNRDFTRQILDHGLEKGYATYWHAYNNEIFSDLQLRFGGVSISSTSAQAYYWLVDSETFIPEEGRSFLLLDAQENETLSPNMEAILGRPQESFTVYGMYIYVFDHDIASDLNYGLEDGLLRPTELNWTDEVRMDRDALELSPGGIVFGPYATLEAGEYRVTFVGENLTLGDIDVHSEALGDRLRLDEVSRTDEAVAFELTVTDEIEDAEFRVFNNSQRDRIRLKGVLVEPLEN